MVNTLNRKYLMQAIDGSLERLGVDFLDLIYCHRADPETPIEETVWAMSDIVSSGKVKIQVNHVYPLRDVQQVHRDLEARQTTGCVVMLPQ